MQNRSYEELKKDFKNLQKDKTLSELRLTDLNKDLRSIYDELAPLVDDNVKGELSTIIGVDAKKSDQKSASANEDPKLKTLGAMIDLVTAKLLEEKITNNNKTEYDKLVLLLEEMINKLMVDNRAYLFDIFRAQQIINTKIKLFEGGSITDPSPQAIVNQVQNGLKELEGLWILRADAKLRIKHLDLKGEGKVYEPIIRGTIAAIDASLQQVRGMCENSRYCNAYQQVLSKEQDNLISMDCETIPKKLDKLKKINELLDKLDRDCQRSANLYVMTMDIRRSLEDSKIKLLEQTRDQIYKESKTKISKFPADQRDSIFDIENKAIDQFNQVDNLCRLANGPTEEQQDQMKGMRIDQYMSNLQDVATDCWYMKDAKVTSADRRNGIIAGILTGLAIIGVVALLAFPPTGLATLMGGALLSVGWAAASVFVAAGAAIGAVLQGYREGRYKGGIVNGFFGGVKGALKGGLTAVFSVLIAAVSVRIIMDGGNIVGGGRLGRFYTSDLRDGYEKAKTLHEAQQQVLASGQVNPPKSSDFDRKDGHSPILLMMNTPGQGLLNNTSSSPSAQPPGPTGAPSAVSPPVSPPAPADAPTSSLKSSNSGRRR